ncbi:RNA-binding protein S1 [bacterium]|nr:RNA-binding protein S1 [bacterium]
MSVDDNKSQEEIIGKTVEGSITNITNFGAFVSIEGNEEGLVHISEIANEFISDISDFVSVGDKVKVKVLARNQKKKLELSIKKADGISEKAPTKKVEKKEKTKPKNFGFEDKLTSFLKRSEERQIDIRRNLKNKQGLSKRKNK